jgi:predicted dehydrogenase
MPTQTIGIIVNGATGRICSTQHLKNSLIAIRDQGGLALGDKQVIPRPMLVGRDAARLGEVARTYGVADWTTDVDAALADEAFPVFFDAAATGSRLALLKKAVAAGKHIYSEKPVVPSVADGRALLAAAQARGLKHGAVEDKLYLPGFRKLARVLSDGTLGRIVGFKLEFGWWVFDGVEAPTQRPSWNYRHATGGGLVLDMFPHWRYVIEGLLGRIRRVAAATSTAIPERVDERGVRYKVDVEDNASALVELESGAFGTILSSWATRVRRDDLLMLQIDGTAGTGCIAAACRPRRRRSRIFCSIEILISITAPAGPIFQRTARSSIPIARAGRNSCATSSPARRSTAIFPPASATSPSPKPVTAAWPSGAGWRLNRRIVGWAKRA